MTVDMKRIVCEECGSTIAEAGVYLLYDMIWKQHPQTNLFNFYYADLSERQNHALSCNQCGREVPDHLQDLLDDLQTVELAQGEYSIRLMDEELEALPKNCEECGTSFADGGVYQLWDVIWAWNENEQRFVFKNAYASELEEYAVCCNQCGCPIEEDLPLEIVKTEASNQ